VLHRAQLSCLAACSVSDGLKAAGTVDICSISSLLRMVVSEVRPSGDICGTAPIQILRKTGFAGGSNAFAGSVVNV
jgi:hypothetical protein